MEATRPASWMANRGGAEQDKVQVDTPGPRKRTLYRGCGMCARCGGVVCGCGCGTCGFLWVNSACSPIICCVHRMCFFFTLYLVRVVFF